VINPGIAQSTYSSVASCNNADLSSHIWDLFESEVSSHILTSLFVSDDPMKEGRACQAANLIFIRSEIVAQINMLG
jgi:hypothetical protein